MSANVNAQGARRVLDRVQDAETVNESDVQEPAILTRILIVMRREVARLAGLWRPRRIDFEGIELDDTGTTPFRFEHRFGGPARAWVVGWSGADPPNIRIDAASDSNSLVLTSTVEGTATIRVEEAG